MDNSAIWTCINGHTGNDGNFCTICGTKDRLVTWTCLNGHAGNIGKFCSQCGAINTPAATVASSYNPPSPVVNQPVYQFDPSAPKPEGWQVPVAPTVQAPPADPPISKEDNKKANRLNILCIVLFFMPVVLQSIFENSDNKVPTVVGWLEGLTFLSAFVIFLYVRTKYPKNVGAKVIQYLLITAVIGMIIMIVLLMIACHVLCDDCSGL